MQLDAAGCRAKADEMRERAKTTRDPVAHKELLMLAEQYEMLARHAAAEEPEVKSATDRRSSRGEWP